jgi:hypothetical protein
MKDEALSPAQRRHVAAIRKLIHARRWGDVRQGLELARALDDEAILASLRASVRGRVRASFHQAVRLWLAPRGDAELVTDLDLSRADAVPAAFAACTLKQEA